MALGKNVSAIACAEVESACAEEMSHTGTATCLNKAKTSHAMALTVNIGIATSHAVAVSAYTWNTMSHTHSLEPTTMVHSKMSKTLFWIGHVFRVHIDYHINFN